MTTGGDHDRVVMASRKADGTPDQTPDFTYIGDKEVSKTLTEEQLLQQRVSAADVEVRGVAAGGSAGGASKPDKVVAPIVAAHEKAAKDAAKDASSEVDARFEDVETTAASRRSSGRETTAAVPAAETTADK
jgi:K+-transporting ATPase c subunit